MGVVDCDKCMYSYSNSNDTSEYNIKLATMCLQCRNRDNYKEKNYEAEKRYKHLKGLYEKKV